MVLHAGRLYVVLERCLELLELLLRRRIQIVAYLAAMACNSAYVLQAYFRADFLIVLRKAYARLLHLRIHVWCSHRRVEGAAMMQPL